MPDAAMSPAYLFDAGRSHAIDEALRPLLSEVATLLGADVGLVLYRQDAPVREVRLLAGTGATIGELPLPNEPLVLGQEPSRRHPSLLVDLEVSSSVRRYRLWLRSAVAIPWTDPFGAGTLLMGNTTSRPLSGRLDHHLGARGARDATAAVQRGRQYGEARIKGDLHQALEEVADASVSGEDAESALGAILVSARDLFDSEVAYLSIPEDDEAIFTFDQVLGIRTHEFRHLRIALGQGLGGLARSQQQAVRSIDYATDTRLRAAPVAETVREGIVSAMAAPMLVDDEVKGVLYVGNRRFKPFTESDEGLLNDFAGYATLGLKRRIVDEYRARVIRRQERERLALDVHDSVVRRLVQIGFEADNARRGSGSETMRRHMAVIGQAAEDCMESLRDHLALLTRGHHKGAASASAVLDRVVTTWKSPDVTRTCKVLGTGPQQLMPPELADSVVRIGHEALVNADLHSGCSRQHVTLEVTGSSVTLMVSDDGCGLDGPVLDQVLAGGGGHLGFHAMRATAADAGGRLAVAPSALGGLAVSAVIPLHSKAGWA